MTWDGVPEHRNLQGDGEKPAGMLTPEQRKAYLDSIAEARARMEPPQNAGGAAHAHGPEMPPDPFSGSLPGAIAQAEMLRSLLEGGFTEPQALYYMACLVQVGLAMRMGRFAGDLPPWPTEEP